MAAKYPAVRKLGPEEIRAMMIVGILMATLMAVFTILKKWF
jgi:hypothetical protein